MATSGPMTYLDMEDQLLSLLPPSKRCLSLGAVGPPAAVQHHRVPRQGRGRVGDHALGLRQVRLLAAPAAIRRYEPFGQRLALRHDRIEPGPQRLVLRDGGASLVVAERSAAGTGQHDRTLRPELG